MRQDEGDNIVVPFKILRGKVRLDFNVLKLFKLNKLEKELALTLTTKSAILSET